jgi:hypothetical protein
VSTPTGRPSAPTLLRIGRGIEAAKEELLASWIGWLSQRQMGSPTVEIGALERPLRLILSLLVHMTGPLRHEAKEPWYASTELYGRLAEARGLSAGEVVEEMQYLRELLLIHLADLFVALPVRHQLPAMLRMSRVLDTAVSNATVGYTDALVEKMFSKDGVPVPTADSVQELLNQLHVLESDAKLLAERSAG